MNKNKIKSRIMLRKEYNIVVNKGDVKPISIEIYDFKILINKILKTHTKTIYVNGIGHHGYGYLTIRAAKQLAKDLTKILEISEKGK